MFISANRTAFPAEMFVFVDKDARKRAVVVVKATFDVAEDGRCRPADEQAPIVYADEHYGDPATTGVRYESDCVPPKPRSDVLVVGDAVAPPDRRVTSMDVAVAGPGLRKSARVLGDRVWLEAAGGPVASSPEPFERMPLSFDRAFGGRCDDHPDPACRLAELRNLVGRGFYPDERTAIGRPLPNIERPGSEVRAWTDRPEPIGFGVIGRGWASRIPFAGTYDEQWMKERMPFLPHNFDLRYFQCAPPDQQGLSLAPGERYQCLNMSASGRFTVELPPYRVSVRFCIDDRTERRDTEADTLIVEPSRNRIMLVWRAAMVLPRKLVRLREVQVGPPARAAATA